MNDQRRKAIEKLIKDAGALDNVQDLINEFNDSTDAAWEEFENKLDALKGRADTLYSAIDEIKGEEEEYLDGMPEGLKSGDKGTQAEEAISAMDEALAKLDEIKDHTPDKPVLDDFNVVADDIAGDLETALG